MRFEVYDGRNNRLLSDNSHIEEAATARKALQQYLNKQGEGHVEFCNTADNDVIWKTTPFKEIDGQKYLVGRISWWGIKATLWEGENARQR